MTLHLSDLFPLDDLNTAISGGYVRSQTHPTLPLRILNYTQKTQYEQAWTEVTEQCRGLIHDTRTGEVVARPFRKFHNYGSPQAGALDLDAPVTVLDKADGSLGVLFPAGDGRYEIATRGSFTSDQALHATRVWQEKYAPTGVAPYEGETWLFEIVYPENRIVLDYGDTDDLILLGAVANHTGRVISPAALFRWTGPTVQEFPYTTLGEAVAAPPRENAEGLVVRFGDGRMVKLKQDDYLALHRILTNTTTRTVWEFIAVNECAPRITARKHWGSRLRLDPARADEIMQVGGSWLHKFIEAVPDEFHDWVRRTFFNLHAEASALTARLETEVAALRERHGDDRKAVAAAIKGHEHSGALFLLYDGRDITVYVWAAVAPVPERLWQVSEVAA